MSKIFSFLLLFFVNSIISKTWQEIFDSKKLLFDSFDYSILKDQFEAYSKNNSPIIANPVIKNIPIVECNEEIIDIRNVNHARISMLPDSPENKSFAAPIYNSGLPNASKIRKSIWLKLEKMIIYLDELSEDFGYKKNLISIKVFEGLRDLKTQKQLFDNKFSEIKLQNPNMTDEAIETETSKWVSPVKNNVPVHSTGAAIDIRLWNNETNDFVDLGAFGVIWGANKEAQTFSENISDLQKSNRLYLLMAATKAGLINYSYEYWHFSCGDRYAQYWLEKDENRRYAIFGSIS